MAWKDSWCKILFSLLAAKNNVMKKSSKVQRLPHSQSSGKLPADLETKLENNSHIYTIRVV
jgi:hypothetical protein